MQQYFRAVIIAVLLSITTFANGQNGKRIVITFKPTFRHTPVALETYYHLSGNDSVTFEALKYYVSGIILYNNDKPVFKENNSFHLVDAEDEQTMSIDLNIPDSLDYNVLSFNLGIDSATSTSGILSGDLDPAKGMYWAWQGGYINFKLDGKSNLCPARKNEFDFHLGGYLPPNYAMQSLRLSIKSKIEIIIELPLDKFIAAIDLSKQNSIMIPGKEAVALSKLAAQLFEITAP